MPDPGERHRIATREDLARIVEIYNATVASRMVTADLEPVAVASRVKWFEEHSPNSRPLWVAQRDDEITGWLSFSSFYGRAAYDKTVELSVYVDERFRGQGIGAYLLGAAIAHAPSIRVDTLLGFIFAHNIPSIRLFEKFGFARWAHMPGVARLEDVERDLVIVGRKVP
jgi:L-amino acid N-acyltransferase YncA